MKKHWSDRLVEMQACPEAIKWARIKRSLAAAWTACDRGDWMLWLLDQISADRRKFTWVAAQCARLVLHLVPEGEDRPRLAIEAAEAFSRGEATVKDCLKAAYAAADAADVADAAYSVAAYSASVSAADAAFSAYAAFASAADAADAAYAACAATRAAERQRILSRCAELVRETFSRAPKLPKREKK